METMVDPGRIARFEAVKLDGNTPEVIVQRLADGESLMDIAREWKIPPKRFLAWVAANGELSDRCRRVRELAGIELRMEGLEILDEATPEDISVRKEQANYRKELSRDLNKPLFGAQLKVEKTVRVEVDAGLVGFAGALLEKTRPAERVVLPVADDEDDPVV